MQQIFLLFGILLVIIRLYLNFSTDLVLGLNGGYYPLQVRSVLETGWLGFPDMPLYFFVNAFFVKIASIFTSLDDSLILFINKIVDSFSLAFIVIPFYYFYKKYAPNNLTNRFQIASIAFATLSITPLLLTAGIQKNAAAMPLLVLFVFQLFQFLDTKSRKAFWFASLSLLLTGLTHFGVFSVALLYLFASLLVFYKKKAIIPVIGIGIISLGFVFLFDASRAIRLLQSAFLLIQRPALLTGHFAPMLFFNILIGFPIIGYGIKQIRQGKLDNKPFQKNILIINYIVFFILSFPLMSHDFAMRLSLMAFIPFFMMTLLTGQFFSKRLFNITTVILTIIVVGSVIRTILKPKNTAIPYEAYEDLEKLATTIDTKNTLIIAKHGLEWWTAWQTRAKVGQETAIDKSTFSKYETVISLSIKETNNHNFHPTPFPNPYAPNTKPLYESDYFKAVEVTIDDLEAIQKSASQRRRPDRKKRPHE
ncbi:MAG: hypothetical protein AB8G11_17755 [Saprospiraceae bacterium]